MQQLRVGWIVDYKLPPGGAELDSMYLKAAAPAWAEIIDFPNTQIERGLDVYIINNCNTYNHYLIDVMGEKNLLIKRVHDLWQWGDHLLRQHLLDYADLLVFSSALHVNSFSWAFMADHICLPSALAPFTGVDEQERSGAVWIGRIHESKGLDALKEWAIEAGVPVDIYGALPPHERLPEPLVYKRAIAASEVYKILSAYRTFIHLPEALEPYGRAVAEAYLAGCEIVTNGNVGAVEWIENQPEALNRGADLFWEAVESKL